MEAFAAMPHLERIAYMDRLGSQGTTVTSVTPLKGRAGQNALFCRR
jgi:hypothetical protein